MSLYPAIFKIYKYHRSLITINPLKTNLKLFYLTKEYLLVALRSGIGRISLDTADLFDVVLPIDEVHGAVVLDYHYNLSKLYYADVQIDTIKMVDMKNMSDVRTIVSTGLNTPNGLAVDWLANNLYWSDTYAKVMFVYNKCPLPY